MCKSTFEDIIFKRGEKNSMDKFLGIGLTNALGIALFTMLIIVMLKVIFTLHEVEGISEFTRAV